MYEVSFDFILGRRQITKELTRLCWPAPLSFDCNKVRFSRIVGIIEPQHEIYNNVVCVTSKASEQPVHMRSLIRAFASHLNIL